MQVALYCDSFQSSDNDIHSSTPYLFSFTSNDNRDDWIMHFLHTACIIVYNTKTEEFT